MDTAVLNLAATDNDFGLNAQIVYSIVLEESDAGTLTSGSNTGMDVYLIIY